MTTSKNHRSRVTFLVAKSPQTEVHCWCSFERERGRGTPVTESETSKAPDRELAPRPKAIEADLQSVPRPHPRDPLRCLRGWSLPQPEDSQGSGRFVCERGRGRSCDDGHGHGHGHGDRGDRGHDHDRTRPLDSNTNNTPKTLHTARDHGHSRTVEKTTRRRRARKGFVLRVRCRCRWWVLAVLVGCILGGGFLSSVGCDE